MDTIYTVIQFIQLCSLYSYSFKQVMSVERPSTVRLFRLIFDKVCSDYNV